MASIKSRFGDDTSDDAIAFLENVTDTVNDLETRANGDGTDWKAEAERIDKEWREKYISRFDTPVEDKPKETKTGEEKIVKTYDDLFKTEE